MMHLWQKVLKHLLGTKLTAVTLMIRNSIITHPLVFGREEEANASS